MTQTEAAPSMQAPRGNVRVLVVDDDSRYLNSLSALVTAHGYAVKATSASPEALALARSWRPDVLILDARMRGSEGMDGRELLRLLNVEGGPAILVVSADTRFDAAVEALRAGVADYLAKPYRPEELLRAIRTQVDRRRALAESQATTLPAAAATPATLLAASGETAAGPLSLAETALEEAPFLVYTLDPDGRFTFLNRRAEALFNVDRQDLLQKPWTVLVYGEEQMQQARFRLNERRRGERATIDQPLTLSVPGGGDAGEVHVRLSARGVYRCRDGEEAFAGTCGIAAVNETDAGDTGLEAFLRTIPLPVLILDRDHRLLRANDTARKRPAAAPLMQRTLEGWLGVSTAEWRSFLEQAAGRESLRQLLGDVGGFPRWQASAFRLSDDGTQAVLLDDLGAAASAHDLRVRMERDFQQAARIDAIRHLGGGLAHDFNNILASILGFTELALAQATPTGTEPADAPLAEDDAAQVYLREAITAGHRARDLIRRIVTFCTPEGSGGRSDAVSVIREQAERMRQVLPRAVRLTVNLPEDAVVVDLDEAVLARVFVHLVTNARDALGGAGSIEVNGDVVDEPQGACAACRRELRGRFLKLSVKDSGEGLAPGNGRDLFQLLARSTATPIAKSAGLAVVARELHARQGHVQLHSMRGLGTVVTAYLPLYEASAGQRPGPSPDSTVLIVDDDLSMGWLLAEYLRGLGYGTDLSIDPFQAEQALRSGDARPRVMICDAALQLTGQGRLLDLVAERFPEVIRIALTTGAEPELPEGTIALPQPVARDALATILAQLIETP